MQFGPILARRASEPLGRAKTELGAGRVKQALLALEPGGLSTALRAGVADVAAAAGVPKAEVEGLLDWGPIDLALAALGESRGAAAAAWGELPPIAGGLLAGVAEVTMQAENDDVGFYLDRLGHKMARDRGLAGPIDTLAADVETWQLLITNAARALDAHPRLLTARKRRIIVRMLIAIAVAAVVVPIAIVAAQRHRALAAAQARVDSALDDRDPCAASAISEVDLVVAGAAARARASERTRACGEVRERAERLSRCEALVSAVERRSPVEGEAALAAGPRRALLGRMSQRSLEPIDLVEVPTWPCEETDGSARLWKVFIEAASTSTLLWRDPPQIADEIVTRLAEVGLAQAARGTLLSRAEEISGHGVRQGDEPSLKRGAELCELCRKLRIETAGNCKGLDVVLAKTAANRPP